MIFTNPLQYLLVKRLGISNKKALELIAFGKVMVNRVVVQENIFISETDEVFCDEKLINEGKTLFQIAFYKPRGIETTLNPNIPDNLKRLLPFEEKVFPIGRLDKDSEGLLILTNDGRLYKTLTKLDNHVEKEYIVTVDKPIDTHFIEKMSNGIEIMGKKTLPCPIFKVSTHTFRIILIEGRNRQIRRMCYKLGYEVTQLIRIRIGEVQLDNLKMGEFRVI